LDKDS